MALGRLQLNKLQKGKIAAHVLQALFTFITICVLIAMFVQKGHSGGSGRWYIALCFISIPAWVYLVMTPMWQRTVKFANAFAMAAVDITYTIFWLSALIALGVWVNRGKSTGAKEKKISDGGNCTTFAYGTERKCNLAVAAIGLGVPILLLWMASSGLSIFFILKRKKGEGLPWDDAQQKTYQEADNIGAQSKDAWSSDVQDVGGRDFDDERFHEMRTYGHDEDQHDLLNAAQMGESPQPARLWKTAPSPPPLSHVLGEHEHQLDIELDYQQRPSYGGSGAPSMLGMVQYKDYRTVNPFMSPLDHQ